MITRQDAIPDILAGPILRKLDTHSVTLWLVTSRPVDATIHLVSCTTQESITGETHQRDIQIGTHAHILLLTFTSEQQIEVGCRYQYDVICDGDSMLSPLSHLRYQDTPCHFVRQSKLTHVLHGSCRKPHYEGGDALVALDNTLTASLPKGDDERPDILIMTGDQVYLDDVAGPMMQAIHQVVDALGLFNESLTGAIVDDAYALLHRDDLMYKREQLLPKVANNETLLDTFFGAKEKPVFTSVHAQNHLISLCEMLAMYLLVWSPVCWQFVTMKNPHSDKKLAKKYDTELSSIEDFRQGLPQVHRVLAHISTYMIFDDHDITDDWNLTRGWEEIVYGHPFSKRVVGNALVAYWLCQGWANEPDKFDTVYQHAKTVFQPGNLQPDEFINVLLHWEDWCYSLDTQPMVYVMDSRTRRWRSESNKNKPSGLLDWEALCDFQHTILGQDKVIVVSPAPIFGVKLIEAIQKIFTFFGHALTVDAENWMAHKGTANVILNIFSHKSTPPQFIILSGDVHYNFVYDVSIKHRRHSPHITQFTSSGIKNVFPAKLLAVLDKINQVLYASRSPLNWLTKRRSMKIKARHPDNHPLRNLLNTSALGRLKLNDENDDVVCELLTADGNKVVFAKESDE